MNTLALIVINCSGIAFDRDSSVVIESVGIVTRVKALSAFNSVRVISVS